MVTSSNQNLYQKLSSKSFEEMELIRSSSWKVKIIIFAISIGICTFFFTFNINERSFEKRLYSLEPGYIWQNQTLNADFTFPIYKDEEQYNKEVKLAAKNAVPVFIYDQTAKDKANLTIDSLKEAYFKSIPEVKTKKSKKLKNEKTILKANSDKNGLDAKEYQKVFAELKKFSDEVFDRGFIDISKDNCSGAEISLRILTVHTEQIYSTALLLDSSSYLNFAKKYFSSELNDASAHLAIDLAQNIMKPNFLYSQDLTQKSVKLAEKSVPRTIGIVRQNELIVAKGQPVNDDVIHKLKSYERSRFMTSYSIFNIWSILGSLGHSIIIFGILILYLYFIRKKIFYNNMQVGVLSFLLVFSSFLSWLTIQIPSNLPIEYFVVIPAFSILIAVVFDSRTAFYLTVAMSLMLAGIRSNDYDSGTAMIFAGTLAAYTVKDIQSRTQIFKSTFFIFIGLLFPIIAFGLERSIDFTQILYKTGFSLINATISPLVTFGLLFILERLTSITSDLRLQEYNNLSHPLMLKLSEIAPGTYQHTLSVAMLAEKCAVAIGANALLAKVGAYFHDIGKLAKPEYFVENQLDMENKHNLLTAKKSASTIRSHVSEGMRLAAEYKLPQRIIDFIPMHHGTTLIKHFYAKALEEADDKNTVKQEDFRYPGPKPRSKEAAILMICDPAEALSRLPKDRNKLEKAIYDVVFDRLTDGQFDESNLTMKELKIIEDVCVRNLMGMSHPRVEYKEIPKKEEPKEDFSDEIQE